MTHPAFAASSVVLHVGARGHATRKCGDIIRRHPEWCRSLTTYSESPTPPGDVAPHTVYITQDNTTQPPTYRVRLALS